MHVFTTSMLFDMKLWAYLLAVTSQYEIVGVSPVMSYSTSVSCTVHLQEQFSLENVCVCVLCVCVCVFISLIIAKYAN